MENPGPSFEALFAACVQGDFDHAKLLVEQGVDVNVRDDDGITALILACTFGHDQIAKMLIERGADVNAFDDASGSALITAALFARLDIVRLLLAQGANANLGALIYACNDVPEAQQQLVQMDGFWSRKLEIVQELLKAGADVEAKDERGLNALDVARSNNQPDIVAVLEALIAK